MKKCILLMLALAMICTAGAALGEIRLYDGYEGVPAEKALADQLAVRLAAILGEEVTAVHCADTAGAVDAFLQDNDAENALLLANQDAFVLSLQGYTAKDLRTALLPAALLAQGETKLYASSTALAMLTETTPEALIAYTEEHFFELFIARLVDASTVDYLTLTATAEMYVDQNLYLDYAEMAQAAQEGAPDLIVLGGGSMPEALKDAYQPLYTADISGLWLGAFAGEGMKEARCEQLNGALQTIAVDAEWQAAVTDAGYAPVEAEISFREQTQQMIQSLIRYLTSEGLFFYEF